MRDLWAPKWYSKNRLNGVTEHLMWDKGLPALFRTRSECREWINRTHGYIRAREDLRTEPHGWRLPRPVRVFIAEMP